MNSFIKRIERDDLKEQKQVRTHTPEDIQKIMSKWMMDKGYATGHGDSVVDLLSELEWQVAERERDACALICDGISDYYETRTDLNQTQKQVGQLAAEVCGVRIRERG